MKNDKAQTHFRIGLGFAITGTALFGMKSIFIKLAFLQGVDAATLLALRMLIAFPLYAVILIWVIYRARIHHKAAQHLRLNGHDGLVILALGFMGYYLASILDFEGLRYISAQLERLILFTYPVIVALLSWLIFSEKITFRVGLSLLCTYLGIVVLYSYESSQHSDTTLLGSSLVALAALSFAFYVIFSRAYIQRFGSIFFTSVAMLSSTVFVLIHFFIGHPLSDLNVNAMTWLWAALLAIVSTLIPSFLVSEAILRIGATKTSIAGTLGPVFTVLLAVFILDEAFGWVHLGGMSLVVLGVFILDAKRA